MKTDRIDSTVSTVSSADWKAVENLKRIRVRERLRSLSPRESVREFIHLIRFAEMLPRWGDLEKLRKFEIEELTQWKKKIDTLGRKED